MVICTLPDPGLLNGAVLLMIGASYENPSVNVDTSESTVIASVCETIQTSTLTDVPVVHAVVTNAREPRRPDRVRSSTPNRCPMTVRIVDVALGAEFHGRNLKPEQQSQATSTNCRQEADGQGAGGDTLR